MKTNPLVSVAIVAYNASATIIEALDSVYQQTYPNLELVIADDCSTDNTVALCEAWIAQHKERFVDARIVRPKNNGGLSKNYNLAYDNCRAEWVKELDGDDALLPNCVTDCMNYVQSHEDVVLLFAKVASADDRTQRTADHIFDYSIFNLSQKDLLKSTYIKNQIPAQTVFLNMKKMRELGLRHDESIEMIEDHPMWINAMWKGLKLHFMDKEIVKYRVSVASISNNLVSYRYYCSLLKLYIDYLHDEQYKMDPTFAAKQLYETQTSIYGALYRAYLEEKKKGDSLAYKIGRAILYPSRLFKKIFKRK